MRTLVAVASSEVQVRIEIHTHEVARHHQYLFD